MSFWVFRKAILSDCFWRDNVQGSPGTKDKQFPAARPQSAPCATYCYPTFLFRIVFSFLIVSGGLDVCSIA